MCRFCMLWLINVLILWVTRSLKNFHSWKVSCGTCHPSVHKMKLPVKTESAKGPYFFRIFKWSAEGARVFTMVSKIPGDWNQCHRESHQNFQGFVIRFRRVSHHNCHVQSCKNQCLWVYMLGNVFLGPKFRREDRKKYMSAAVNFCESRSTWSDCIWSNICLHWPIKCSANH